MNARPVLASVPQTLGRFQLVGRLGQGSQSDVYLAFDPQLQREVALKAMRAAGSSEATDALLNEARAVSRLVHAAIVPVYEAGEAGGIPYLVFEYVAGWTLAEFLQRQNVLDAEQAVALLLPVLDAVAYAHAHKVIHRDLKPSNILLDPRGRARVMDFGIAVRHGPATPDADEDEDDSLDRLLGTPAYMAPEFVREGRVSPQMDVYSAGLILFEMLCGHRAVRQEHGIQALQEVASSRLSLPAEMPTYVDDPLRRIVNRALAAATQERYPSMQALLQDLRHWLHVHQSARLGREASEPVRAQGSNQRAALDALIRRMGGELPAMAGSVERFQQLRAADGQNVAALSLALLGDMALSQKLLRAVNATLYKSNSEVEVFTVSHAILVLGLHTVRGLVAATPQLAEHHKLAQLRSMQDECLLAHFSAELAAQLASPQEHEAARCCALFRGLGRYLIQHYFPDEAADIRSRAQGRPEQERAMTEQVLGLDDAALGQGVARHWGLPTTLILAMRRLDAADKLEPPSTRNERLTLLAALAAELGLHERMRCGAQAQAGLNPAAQRLVTALGLGQPALQNAVAQARRSTLELARVLGMDLALSTFAQSLQGPAA